MKKEHEQLISETAKQVVSELMKNNMIKNDRRTPFQKTETLLYNYNNFNEAVKSRYEQIEEIKQVGLRKHSMSVIPTPNSSPGSSDNYIKTEQEKVNEKITEIENSIKVTRNFIDVINREINTLRSEKYFDIIPMKYFEGKTRDEIADYFNCDVKTITRQKNQLINKLQIKLFSDETIRYILLS